MFKSLRAALQFGGVKNTLGDCLRAGDGPSRTVWRGLCVLTIEVEKSEFAIIKQWIVSKPLCSVRLGREHMETFQQRARIYVG